jgi:drug/metabolite transporter (DMT)-like permease
MGRIKWGRVFGGGLLAGLVVFAVDFIVNGAILGKQWQAAYEKLGHPASTSSLIIWFVWALLAGICLAWLYAAARPRFNPGPPTAVKTGVAFWVFGYGLPTIGVLSFHIFPPHLPIISAAAGVAEAILGSLLAGWIYRE